MYSENNIETLTPEEFAAKYLPVLEQRDASNSEPTPTTYFMVGFERDGFYSTNIITANTGSNDLAAVTETAERHAARHGYKVAYVKEKPECYVNECRAKGMPVYPIDEDARRKYAPSAGDMNADGAQETPDDHFDGVLYLRKRGCDFFTHDISTRESDLGNYRLFLEFIDRDGVRVCGDVLRGALRKYSPKGKEQIISENGLYCDFCYENHNGCFAYRVPDHDELRYTRADVLTLVNRLSAAQYERIEFTDELPGDVQRYPEEVLELERAYLAHEHAAMLNECEALIRENFNRWTIDALRFDFRRMTPDEYRRMTLIAFDCMVEKYGVIEASVQELRNPAAMTALNMAAHFFNEQHYVDPYGNMAFLSQLRARSPYYVGRFLDAAHAMNAEELSDQDAR